jgi:D-glycero-D-manno-heptose 1,7-bisphosphate phosphatase
MVGEFAQRGATIDKVYYCPHHPDAVVGVYKGRCECRKPRPGMLLQARDEFKIDMRHSILVGDSRSDVEAAQAAGIGRVYWLGDAVNAPDLPDGYSFADSLEPMIQTLRDKHGKINFRRGIT